MRKPTPAASAARLVAVAFAAPVVAHAVATHSFGFTPGTTSGTSASNGSVMTQSAPVITAAPPAASASSTSSGSSSGSATPTPTNTTQTDQRAAATSQASQRELASGNTSASQIIAATTPQPGATVSPTTSGASSVTTATSGTATGGTTSTGGTGTVVVGTSLGFPGAVGTIVNSGEPAVDANGNLVASNSVYVPAATQVTAYAPAQYAAADVVFADNTMNQVIGEAKRDRHRVGRNGQLLYSIAPRTNVDRSREVPDDGPSPALTGPLAR